MGGHGAQRPRLSRQPGVFPAPQQEAVQGALGTGWRWTSVCCGVLVLDMIVPKDP